MLACPACKGALTLRVEREEGEDVVAGGLHCARCDVTYPIEDGIPDLLLREGMTSPSGSLD